MNAGLPQNQTLQLNRNSRFGFMEPERLFSSRTKTTACLTQCGGFGKGICCFLSHFQDESGKIKQNMQKKRSLILCEEFCTCRQNPTGFCPISQKLRRNFCTVLILRGLYKNSERQSIKPPKTDSFRDRQFTGRAIESLIARGCAVLEFLENPVECREA